MGPFASYLEHRQALRDGAVAPSVASDRARRLVAAADLLLLLGGAAAVGLIVLLGTGAGGGTLWAALGAVALVGLLGSLVVVLLLVRPPG